MVNQFYVHPGMDLTPGLSGLASTVQAYGQTKKAEDAAQAAAAKEEALKAEVARLVREGTSQEISEFAVQNPEWGQLVRNESSLRDEGNARTMVNMYYASIDNPSKIPQFLDAYEARLSVDGLTEQESEEIADARQRASSDPEGYLKSMELSVAGLDPERHTQYSSIKEKDVTADIENFEYYSELYKSNPEMADKFAVQVGITPADNYESLMAELEMMKLRQEVTAGEVEAVEKVEAKEAAETAKVEAMETSQVQLDRTLSQIDDIVAATEEAPLATGLPGFVLGGIKGTEAYGIRGDVELIKSKLALDMIKEMKQQSSTGATGFGAMSEKELALIQSAVDRLDPDMDRDRFMQAMAEVKGHYTLWKEYNDKALAEEAAIESGESTSGQELKAKEDILSNLGF